MEGFNFSFKKPLTFLPHWARGLQVFANASTLHATGDAAANFEGYVPRSINWGISLSREKFSVQANWNYRGRLRDNPLSGQSIEPGTYIWSPSRLFVEFTGEYQLTDTFAAFTKVRNLTDEAQTDTIYEGPNTLPTANFNNRVKFGAFWTFGLRARF